MELVVKKVPLSGVQRCQADLFARWVMKLGSCFAPDVRQLPTIFLPLWLAKESWSLFLQANAYLLEQVDDLDQAAA
jgi:hypothetical protein